MEKTFEKVLDAMPCEYKDSFLQYNLLKRHISLYVKGACQCSVKREFEEACSPFGELEAAAVLCSLQCSVKRKIEEKCSPFGSLEAAAVLCSFRGLPARYRLCSYCGLPEQGGPKQLDLELQISEFENLLHKELEKINKFFNLLHRQYIGRMKELDAMRSQEVSGQNRRRSEDRELWIDPEIELKIRQRIKTTAAKIDLLASYCTLNRAAFIKILKKHDRKTDSDISRDFSERLQEMDFVFYERAVKQDAKYCLSLLGSSTGSSSSVAADRAAPRMSDRERKLWLGLQQERVQFLSSSDGNFDYIEAAKVAKDAIAAWSPTV